MLTLRPDPLTADEPEDTPTIRWTVLSNDRPIGQAWKGRLDGQYTLVIQGASITEPSMADALTRARQHFGEDDPRGQIESLIAATRERIAEAEATQGGKPPGALRGLLLALEDAAAAADVIAEQSEPAHGFDPKATWHTDSDM